ncbi:AAA family ATPase [Bacillus sp. FJAT-53711]|uniref:AAA family ATPase n=1 Tax=Bacillus yunxiaonensis TaxID=3127665 RepID=A0ABU8FQM5_9BACI
MPILCLEGASAVGKTTIGKELEKRYGAYIVPEVNLLFKRPADEQKNWYLDRQVERWKIALEQSRNNELVVLDGDIYQPFSYNWCFHFQVFGQTLSSLETFYCEKMFHKEIGLPDCYFYLYINNDTLRQRKEHDVTRRRGNFEKHIHITEPHKKYYTALNKIKANYCTMIEANLVQETVEEIMDTVFSANFNLYDRYNVKLLNEMIYWLQENKA